jgi:hypothetical protein
VSLYFINALLWPLVILVGVPLLVHLFARARPPKLDFSSVEFIQRALRFTQRVKKPKDWLLLILRTVAVGAMILLFLRPVLFSHSVGSLFERRNVAVILDVSASMGWADGSQTRFAVACAEASEILAGLSSRDSANVILAGATARSVFPAMGGNIGYLQGEVRRARLSSDALDPEAAIRLAVQLLNGQEGRKEICIISDFQASNWTGVKPRLPPDMGLTCVSVARGEAPNAAILRTEIEPVHPLPGEESTLLCEVANFAPVPQRKTVVLSVESARTSREVVLPAWGRTTVLFKHRISTAAPFAVTMALAEDGFPGDDRRWTLVEPVESLRVGLLASGKGAATAAAWTQACRALGWVRIEPLNTASDYDVVMLAGWDGQASGPVRGFLERGIPVVWYPAAGIPLSRVMSVLTNAPAAAAEVALAWDDKPDTMRLKVAAPDHAVFRPFANGEYGDPARGRVRGRLSIPTAQLPAGEVLLAYTDGTPALWQARGAKPLFLWNIALESALSTVQDQGEFVPLFGELLLEARRGGGSLPAVSRQSVTGQALVWQPGLEIRADDVHLKGPDGSELPIRLLEINGGTWMSAPVERAGVYDWLVGDRLLGRQVANFPAVESDLRPMTGAEVKGLGAVTAASGRDVRDWQAGIPLWPRLLWIALGLLLCESLVVGWDTWKRSK